MADGSVIDKNQSQQRNLVVVCIADHPKSIALLRLARNRADRIGGRWRAVFIDIPAYAASGVQERMLRLLTRANRMGGETAHIEAETTEKGITTLLESERGGIAVLIVGSVDSQRLIKFHRDPWECVIKYARRQRVSVEIIPLSGQQYRRSLQERFRFFRPRHIIYALLSVWVAYLGAMTLHRILPPALFRINNQNIGLLFMTACAFVAGRFGLLPGLVASIASSFTYNYYFTYDHINLSSVTDLLNIAIFLFAALLISLFTSQTRGFAEKAARRERSSQVLFNLYRIASDASSRQQVLENLQHHLAHTLAMDVAFFLPPVLHPDGIELAFPHDLLLNDTDVKAIELCWKEMKTTGLGSLSYPESFWRFEPMLATGGEIGVLGVRPRKRSQLDVWLGLLLSTIADQIATIIERIELEKSIEASHINEEREKLRSMLLSSVTHDLKTPLASIIGSLAIYRSQGERLTAEKRATLIETAQEEAERLDSFITNILDMTRLESKIVEFKQAWYDPQHIVREILKRMEYRMRRHQITVYPIETEIEVYMDYMMTGQVLQNILDNACKYTSAGTVIELHCIAQNEGGFCFEIRDHGKGLPPEKMNDIFDKYARLHMRDLQVAGTGLGLAISKAIMEAQEGSIAVANHPDGGAVFTCILPKWRAANTEVAILSQGITLPVQSEEQVYPA